MGHNSAGMTAVGLKPKLFNSKSTVISAFPKRKSRRSVGHKRHLSVAKRKPNCMNLQFLKSEGHARSRFSGQRDKNQFSAGGKDKKEESEGLARPPL